MADDLDDFIKDLLGPGGAEPPPAATPAQLDTTTPAGTSDDDDDDERGGGAGAGGGARGARSPSPAQHHRAGGSSREPSPGRLLSPVRLELLKRGKRKGTVTLESEDEAAAAPAPAAAVGPRKRKETEHYVAGPAVNRRTQAPTSELAALLRQTAQDPAMQAAVDRLGRRAGNSAEIAALARQLQNADAAAALGEGGGAAAAAAAEAPPPPAKRFRSGDRAPLGELYDDLMPGAVRGAFMGAWVQMPGAAPLPVGVVRGVAQSLQAAARRRPPLPPPGGAVAHDPSAAVRVMRATADWSQRVNGALAAAAAGAAGGAPPAVEAGGGGLGLRYPALLRSLPPSIAPALAECGAPVDVTPCVHPPPPSALLARYARSGLFSARQAAAAARRLASPPRRPRSWTGSSGASMGASPSRWASGGSGGAAGLAGASLDAVVAAARAAAILRRHDPGSVWAPVAPALAAALPPQGPPLAGALPAPLLALSSAPTLGCGGGYGTHVARLPQYAPSAGVDVGHMGLLSQVPPPPADADEVPPHVAVATWLASVEGALAAREGGPGGGAPPPVRRLRALAACTDALGHSVGVHAATLAPPPPRAVARLRRLLDAGSGAGAGGAAGAGGGDGAGDDDDDEDEEPLEEDEPEDEEDGGDDSDAGSDSDGDGGGGGGGSPPRPAAAS